MKLEKIKISNFRSIKEAEIDFTENCQIFIGKNEAGKTNVLKAIAAVFGQYKVSVKDKRKKIDNEKIENEAYFVLASILLEEKDYGIIVNTVTERLAIEGSAPFVEGGHTLESFIREEFKYLLIIIDISENANSPFQYMDFSDKQYTIDENVTDMKIDTLRVKVFGVIKDLYEEDPYTCHIWRYKEDYLLPSEINIGEFTKNPNSCPPLKNLFVLCGIKDIPKAFSEAKSEDNDYINLLKPIAKKTTRILHDTWKDSKDLKVVLHPDGPDIRIKIEEKANYNFEDRSDGFKKFVSIILMISARHRVNLMSPRNILLIDEPDTSLYPTSARYLRDELIRISKSSPVMYTTHSQYMLDSDRINRHRIVEKSKDITTIKKPDENPEFTDDNLLRNAIGTSIFEVIKEENLIFEGWQDKEFFCKYTRYKKIEGFENVGITYLGGIKGYKTLLAIMMLAQKKFVIISDSDQTSKEKKLEFKKMYKEFENCWLDYSTVTKNKEIKTLEDFYEKDYAKEIFEKSGVDFDEKQSIDSNVKNSGEKKAEIKEELIDKFTELTQIKEESYHLLIEELKP